MSTYTPSSRPKTPVATRTMAPDSTRQDEMIDVPLAPPRNTNSTNAADRIPTNHEAKESLRPVVIAVTPPRRQTRSTYQYTDFKSSPPPCLETAPLDGVFNKGLVGDLDEEAVLEPLESPIRPDPYVQVKIPYQYRDCIVSPLFRAGKQPPALRRPQPVLGSPYHFETQRAEQDPDCDADSDWSSDYGSPKDAATHYLPASINNEDILAGSSPYVNIPEHCPLSMAKNLPSPYYATTADQYPLSVIKEYQASPQSYTPASGFSSPYVDMPEHYPLGYDPYYGTGHQPESEQPHAPRFGSKLKYTLRSSSPHQDEDFAERDEWDESPLRGRTRFCSTNMKYELVEKSPSPLAKVHRSRKSRMTSYGLVGGARVFSAALDGLVTDEAEILEDAVGKSLPYSPAVEDASEAFPDTQVQDLATGFAAHDPEAWDDDVLEELQPRPREKKASKPACQISSETVRNKATRSTRNLSGATVVLSMEGQPQLADEEPVMLVEYEVPAWYAKEQAQWQQKSEARILRKYIVEAPVPSTPQPVLPCAGTESCASRVARLEQRNEILAKEVEVLKEKNDYLRIFAVGASCLILGSALVLAQLDL